MITDAQRNRAREFQAMHKSGKMFVLPNAWDVGSAYIYEKQGYKAVATSSAGVAFALGYPDGEEITLTDLIYCAEQIANRVDIPLSVDFERGYAETAAEVKQNALALLNKGVVGFNIEDGNPESGKLDDIDFMISKIKALCELKAELNLDFVINARTCTYLLNVADDEEKIKIATERGNAYKKAGADCIFVPGNLDEETITKIVRGIDAPANILLSPKFHDFKRLNEIGVSRLSSGSCPVRSVYHHLIKLAENMQNGEVENMLDYSISYADANKYFTK